MFGSILATIVERGGGIILVCVHIRLLVLVRMRMRGGE